jgi:hypothetical protein
VVGTRPANISSMGLSSGTVTGLNSHRRVKFPYGAKRVGLVFANVYCAQPTVISGFDNPGPNPINVQASIGAISAGAIPHQGRAFKVYSWDSGQERYVNADGTAEKILTLAGGECGILDTGQSVEVGGERWVHTYVNVASGAYFPMNPNGSGMPGNTARGEGVTSSVGETSKVLLASGTWTTTGQNGQTYDPVAIVDLDALEDGSDWQAALLIGDSLNGGLYGGQEAFSLADKIPVTMIARGQEQATTFTAAAASSRYRRGLWSFCRTKWAALQYLTNDIADNPISLATLQGMDQDLVRFLQRRGIYLVARATLPPTAASVDSWATLSGQYLQLDSSKGQRGINEQTRQDYNAALRAMPLLATLGNGAQIRTWTAGPTGSVVADVWKPLEVLETVDPALGRSTAENFNGNPIGKWVAGYTTDGLHPGTNPGTAAQRAGWEGVIDWMKANR